MKLRYAFLLGLGSFVLAGCVAGDEEVRAFVANTNKVIAHTTEQLPAFLPAAAATYDGFDIPDPFSKQRLSSSGRTRPPAEVGRDRRREPLESFPLNELRMVGTIAQDSRMFALVRANNVIYRLAPGSYVGQDFGRVTEVTPTAINLRELVQDGSGEWTERTVSLAIDEPKPAAGMVASR